MEEGTVDLIINVILAVLGCLESGMSIKDSIVSNAVIAVHALFEGHLSTFKLVSIEFK